MTHKKMFGFVDPITLGILVALGGTAFGIMHDKAIDKPVAVSATSSVAQTPAPATSLVQAERTVTR